MFTDWFDLNLHYNLRVHGPFIFSYSVGKLHGVSKMPGIFHFISKKVHSFGEICYTPIRGQIKKKRGKTKILLCCISCFGRNVFSSRTVCDTLLLV